MHLYGAKRWPCACTSVHLPSRIRPRPLLNRAAYACLAAAASQPANHRCLEPHSVTTDYLPDTPCTAVKTTLRHTALEEKKIPANTNTTNTWYKPHRRWLGRYLLSLSGVAQ
jgi:hypothetical protein